MLKNNFVQISDRLTETFMEKRVYFNNYDNGVILISTSRGDYQAEDHLCEAISALIAENLNLRVAGNSVISSSLGIDGALIIFEKKDQKESNILAPFFLLEESQNFITLNLLYQTIKFG